MLSVGELLLLNQLLYCPGEEVEKGVMGTCKGKSAGDLLGQWLRDPFPDGAELGICIGSRNLEPADQGSAVG